MVAENHVTLCKHRELATMHREILLALGQIWIVAHQYFNMMMTKVIEVTKCPFQGLTFDR